MIDWKFTGGDILNSVGMLCGALIFCGTVVSIYWRQKGRLDINEVRLHGIEKELTQASTKVDSHHQQNQTAIATVGESVRTLATSVEVLSNVNRERFTHLGAKMDHLDECFDRVQEQARADAERIWDDQRRQDRAIDDLKN